MATEQTQDPNIPPPFITAPIQIEPSVCHVCHESMDEGADCLIIHDCSHGFHRSCIEAYLSTQSACPECKRSCQLSELRKLVIVAKVTSVRTTTKSKPRGALAKHYNTRQSQKQAYSDGNQQNANNPHEQTTNVGEINPNNITEFTLTSPIRMTTPTPTPTPTPTRTNTVSIDYSEINRLIEENLKRILGNLNLVPQSNTYGVQNNNQNVYNRQNNNLQNNVQNHGDNIPNPSNDHEPQRQQSVNGNNHYPFSPIEISNLSTNSMHGGKITSIIQNWNLKFDGSSTGLHVEEFLYRVRSLTQDNFNGDLGIICKNLHILLTGKARDWYWRYHKKVESIQWDEFCDAIRSQYKMYKSSFDIREEVRNRKQKAGETFDTFFESILSIMDRLPTPMSDMELIEILARNLRPEIRQDLLYVPIHSISHLRKLVQMREHFLNEESVRKTHSVRNPNPLMPRRYIADIDSANEICDENGEFDSTINAIQSNESQTKCWNCDELGHHWQNCLQDRTIFCYGCGLKNVYRPNCLTCANRKNQTTKNFRPSGPLKDN